MRLSIAEVLQATGGELLVAPAKEAEAVTGITWDSREASPGCLYVALEGERADGHAYIAAAFAAGARMAFATRRPEEDALAAAREAGGAVVLVDDAHAALARLAGAWRERLQGVVVGLTGSVGKTTTKNLVRDVLSAGFPVTATFGNQNNELGVPNTLLSARVDDGATVVEMGMRGRGQIEQLCSFARPDWGLVSNVGSSHLELLGTREGIARAKGELLEALPRGGWAFLNGADEYAAFMRDEARLDERGVRVAVFDGSDGAASRMEAALAGASEGAVRAGDALVWAQDVELDGEGRARFVLCAAGFPPAPSDGAPAKAAGPQKAADGASPLIERVPCRLALRGAHNVGNACSAAAVGRAAGMALPLIAEALAQSQPEAGRAQVRKAARGVVVLDDSYNANPDSMRASLRTFSSMEAPGKKIAVLGDMGELGAFAEEGHRQVGEDAAAAGVDLLVCVGPLSRGIASAARGKGLPAASVVCVDDAPAALSCVRERIGSGDAVLVKASHAMGLERVVEGLVG